MPYAFRRATGEAQLIRSGAECSYSDLEAKVCYEKNEFSTHDGEFFIAHLGPTLGSNLIPTIMCLGKVTTRVNNPHRNSGCHEKLYVP